MSNPCSRGVVGTLPGYTGSRNICSELHSLENRGWLDQSQWEHFGQVFLNNLSPSGIWLFVKGGGEGIGTRAGSEEDRHGELEVT